jgi:hypothetical protein
MNFWNDYWMKFRKISTLIKELKLKNKCFQGDKIFEEFEFKFVTKKAIA